MEEGFWFTSDLFHIQPGEDEETNPGCYGIELGRWLHSKLRELGYDAEPPIAEDWGWCVVCYNKEYLLWIGCGSMIKDDFAANGDSPGSVPQGRDVVWHVFPVVEVPFVAIRSWMKKLVGKLDTGTPLRKLQDDLNMILMNEPRIQLDKSP